MIVVRAYPAKKDVAVAYYRHGREVRESSKSAHERDATKLLKKRLGEMASGKFVGPNEERVTFENLATAFEADYELRGLRSLRAAKARIKHLREYLEDYRAREITCDRIRAYQAQRRRANASAATVNRETAALGRMFRLAIKSNRATH